MSSQLFVSYFLMIFTFIFTAIADTNNFTSTLAGETYTLDVAKLDQTSYKEFIKTLRESLPIKKDPPELPAKTRPPQWFDLRLIADKKVTTVRFLKHNLYVIGYHAQNPTTNWFELQDTEGRAIEKSELLDYSNSYYGMGKMAHKSITEVSLTQPAFYTAVSTLANSDQIPKKSSVTQNQERAKALMLMALMVSEACRFVDISNYLASNIFNTPTYLEGWMRCDLVVNWSKLSTYVLQPKTFVPPTIDGKVIDSVAKLREKLGVVIQPNKKVVADDDVDDKVLKINDVQAQFQDIEPAGKAST